MPVPHTPLFSTGSPRTFRYSEIYRTANSPAFGIMCAVALTLLWFFYYSTSSLFRNVVESILFTSVIRWGWIRQKKSFCHLYIALTMRRFTQDCLFQISIRKDVQNYIRHLLSFSNSLQISEDCRVFLPFVWWRVAVIKGFHYTMRRKPTVSVWTTLRLLAFTRHSQRHNFRTLQLDF